MGYRIREKLRIAPQWVFIIYAGSAAFLTYLCMYAFRKPFTVATFELADWSYAIDFKSCLIMAQVFGYAISKFIGIKIVSEMTPQRRASTIVVLVSISMLGLLLLPLLPGKLKLLALFINGLPLGMVWGLIFGYLEGRRITEALGAIFSASFIFGSGIVKTVGKWLLQDVGVSELWMPFCVGAIFLLPLLIFVWALTQIPDPDEEDIRARHKRVPMNKTERWEFFRNHQTGLVLLVLVYMSLTALRDFTDNFAAEIWTELGYGAEQGIFTYTSLPVSIVVLAILFWQMKIINNLRALMINHLVIAAGFLIVLLSCMVYSLEWISGLTWFLCLNIGIYMAYIPFNCILFDRLVACTRSLANAGFLIYLADSFGYLASVNVMLFKSLAQTDISWLEFTLSVSRHISLLGILLIFIAAFYFRKKFSRELLIEPSTRKINECTI